MSPDRPDPDDLLARVQAEEDRQRRGKLKIFFGMAPGVGKTYAMLQAARKMAADQVEVLVGYIEPHARPETMAMVLGLDLLPRRSVRVGGKSVEEFDLEAALARKPELILVDELAHTNAEGSTHNKRWQDVEDLLAAGIDVFTTLNVQHLESLNDIVAHVTSIPVRETLPDRIFEHADEVELVDLAPDDLIERLREGKVYVSEQAARALEHFFRKGNLFALRELALRKTAERVSEQAIGYRQQNDVSRIWPTSERILVCVGPSPLSARLIRATRRMATSLHAPWIALHIDLEQDKVASPAVQRDLESNLRLAGDLGAKVESVYGTDFAEAVINYARHHNITRIVVGKTRMSRWHEWLRGSLVNELIRRSGNIDISVISGDGEPIGLPRSPVERKPIPWMRFLGAIGAVLCSTAISIGVFPILAPTNLVMIYLAGVVAVSLIWGRGPSILTTVLSVAAFDYFFVEPYGTFSVTDTQYVLTFIVMLITGLTVSGLASRTHFQKEAIRERERRTSALLELSRELTQLPTQAAIAQATYRILKEAFDVDAWIVSRKEQAEASLVDRPSENPFPEKHAGVIRWVFDHGRAAGAGTDTLPGTDATYLPLIGTDQLVGVLGVKPVAVDAKLSNSKIQLVGAFANQVAMALERCQLASDAEHVRLQMETERLRNTLLSAISHDLRTPLAGITGAASLLVEGNDKLAAESRGELASSILDQSDRLNRLVANLLDLTRIEAGAIQLQRVLQPIEEVVEVVLGRMERELREHPVKTHLPANLPPVAVDGLLIQQVLINLFDNAAKFSPAGSVIDLTASTQGDALVVEVADRGAGIPADAMDRIFEKFYRIDTSLAEGTGIGLAICRGIVEMHGGQISARNREGGGAVFRFTLPFSAASLRSLPPADSSLSHSGTIEQSHQ